MINAIVRKSDSRIMNFNRTGHGTFDWSNDNFKIVKIPNQNVDQFYEQTETGEMLKEIYHPDDISYPLDFAKQKKLEEIRSKANEIITKKWPLWKQQNANARIYPQATKDQKDQDIADVISASNNAEDEVNNATTIDDVESVSPNWPTI